MQTFDTFQDALDTIATELRDERQRKGVRFFDPQGKRIPWLGTGRGADPAWTHLGICPVAALTDGEYDNRKASAIRVGEAPYVLVITRYPAGSIRHNYSPTHTVVARWERKARTE